MSTLCLHCLHFPKITVYQEWEEPMSFEKKFEQFQCYYLDQKDNQKVAHNMALIKYFDAYQAFCLDLSSDSVLKGVLNFNYK